MMKMFWQRRTVHLEQQYHAREHIYIPGLTADTIRDFAIRIDENLLLQVAHKRRVRKFIGLPDYEIPPSLLHELNNAGFVWMVGSDFIRKFRYHAAVGQDYEWHDHRVFIKQGRFRQALVHYGDIPEFVLDRARIAQELCIDNFTIHSMLPLPVSFLLTDPVLVGWPALPSIEIHNYGKGNQEIGFVVEEIKGIVIAVWDANAELEV
jgi:hypothetical protein